MMSKPLLILMLMLLLLFGFWIWLYGNGTCEKELVVGSGFSDGGGAGEMVAEIGERVVAAGRLGEGWRRWSSGKWGGGYWGCSFTPPGTRKDEEGLLNVIIIYFNLTPIIFNLAQVIF